MSVDFILVQKYLSGMEYPATKEELIRHAERNSADDEALEALRAIPDGEYEGPNRVSEAVART